MKSTLQFDFNVDKQNKQVHVKREFAAPLKTVWAAWTDSKILDKWWAPKPWKAKTKSQDFKPGGSWYYAMVGPDGTEHWCIAEYKTVDQQKSYSLLDAFTDPQGNINTEMPRSFWTVSFTDKKDHTIVDIVIKHERLEDLEKLIEMGFKEGFTMGMENLDEVLESKS